MNVLRGNLELILAKIGKEMVAEAKMPTYKVPLYTSMMGTAMAHRVEWWPFGTVIRRASVQPYPVKAMYIGDGSAITIDNHHDVISVNPDDWVSVPEGS